MPMTTVQGGGVLEDKDGNNQDWRRWWCKILSGVGYAEILFVSEVWTLLIDLIDFAFVDNEDEYIALVLSLLYL